MSTLTQVTGETTAMREIRRLQEVVKVAHITFDGSTLVVPANELVDHIGDDEDNTYQVRFGSMKRSELEAMPEFEGW